MIYSSAVFLSSDLISTLKRKKILLKNNLAVSRCLIIYIKYESISLLPSTIYRVTKKLWSMVRSPQRRRIYFCTTACVSLWSVIAKWATRSFSRPQPATDDGVNDCRSNWLAVYPHHFQGKWNVLPQMMQGRVDDLPFFEYLIPFCFLSIVFHCTFSTSC